MTDTLIPTEPSGNDWHNTAELAAFPENEQRHRNAQLLSHIPAAEKIRKEREALAKKEAEIEAREQAELAKFEALEHENRIRKALEKEIKSGEEIIGYARAEAEGLVATILQHSFSGLHPNLNFQGYPGALRIAQEALGAKLLVELYPQWRAAIDEKLEKSEAMMIALAKELKITDRLPAELQARAKA